MSADPPLSHASVLSFQNGLMLKVTETCPEVNCSLAEQILPDGRCCNVCRGTCPSAGPPSAGVERKHVQFAFFLFFLVFFALSFLPPHLVHLLLGPIPQPRQLLLGPFGRSSRCVGRENGRR